MSKESPDVFYDFDDKGTKMVLWFNPDGKLGKCVPQAEVDKVWLFKDVPFEDTPDKGSDLPAGSYWTGRTHVETLAEIGLTCERRTTDIPDFGASVEKIQTRKMTFIGWMFLVDGHFVTWVYDGEKRELTYWDRGYEWSVWNINQSLRDPSTTGLSLPKWWARD